MKVLIIYEFSSLRSVKGFVVSGWKRRPDKACKRRASETYSLQYVEKPKEA